MAWAAHCRRARPPGPRRQWAGPGHEAGAAACVVGQGGRGRGRRGPSGLDRLPALIYFGPLPVAWCRQRGARRLGVCPARVCVYSH